MGARYYHTGLGRFTQQDPLPSSVFGANRYEYAGSDPCNKTDPTGLDWRSTAASCLGAFLNGLAGLSNIVRGVSRPRSEVGIRLNVDRLITFVESDPALIEVELTIGESEASNLGSLASIQR